uniref:Na+/Pi-cotransporter n=1 Tax=Panagrellus redivivus TaxID=6233 RepID=A0A7E4WCN4_PANRE
MAPVKVFPEDQSGKNVKIKHADWHVSAEELIDENHVHWRDLTTTEKLATVVQCAAKLATMFLIVFTFVITLGLLSTVFNLIGGIGIGKVIKNSPVIQNPVSAAIIGAVLTVILQSSSTLLSILVGVISGRLLTVHRAIPILIGAEMGGSIMNALISLSYSGDRLQFRRAFAAATMNDIFNFVCFIVLLPLEIVLAPIEKLSGLIVAPLSTVKAGQFKTLNALTDPIINQIIVIDAEGLNAAAASNATNDTQADTFVRRCVDLATDERVPFCPYDHLFANSTWSDTTIGVVLLLICVGSLVICLVGIVKLMQDLLAGRIAFLLRRVMDKRLPKPFGWLTDYLVMLFGCAVVMVVQSNNVFVSALTPLVGMGVLTLERLYPLIIGSNLGNCFAGVLAAFSADPVMLGATLQIAVCDALYNVFAILLFYPIPFLRRIPIKLAMMFGNITAEYRWFALIYIIVVFVLFPAFLLGISFLPPVAMFTILGLITVTATILLILSFIQKRWPKMLPETLRTWKFLPIWLRSLQPYDHFMTSHLSKIKCMRRFFPKPQFDAEGNRVNSGASLISSKPSDNNMENVTVRTSSHIVTDV